MERNSSYTKKGIAISQSSSLWKGEEEDGCCEKDKNGTCSSNISNSRSRHFGNSDDNNVGVGGCLSSVFVGMDGDEVGTVGLDGNGRCMSFVWIRSVPNLDGLDVGAPDGLCTDIVLLHPHRPYLYAIASFGHHRPSVVITYEISTLYQQPSSLRRIGSSSTVGYRATDAKISPNGRFLVIAHSTSSGGSTLTVFNCNIDGALCKAPIAVQDIPPIPSSSITSMVSSYVSFFARWATFSPPPRHNNYNKVNNGTIPSAQGFAFTPDGSTLIVCDATHARLLSWSMDTTTGQLESTKDYHPSSSIKMPFQITECPHPSWFQSNTILSWSNMALRFSMGIRPIQIIIHPSGHYCFILYQTIAMITWHPILSHPDTNESTNTTNTTPSKCHNSQPTTTTQNIPPNTVGPPLGSISTLMDNRTFTTNNTNKNSNNNHYHNHNDVLEDANFIHDDQHQQQHQQEDEEDASTSYLYPRGLCMAIDVQLSEDGSTLYVLNQMPRDIQGSYITTFQVDIQDTTTTTTQDDDNGIGGGGCSLTPLHRTNIYNAIPCSILLLKQDLLLVSSHKQQKLDNHHQNANTTTTNNNNNKDDEKDVECTQLDIFYTQCKETKAGREGGMKLLSTNTLTKKGASKKVWSMASSSILLHEPFNILSTSV
jgi:hypothetical protein